MGERSENVIPVPMHTYSTGGASAARVVVIIGLLWFAGINRLHIIHFNLFVTLLLLGSIIVVLIVVLTTRPGEQVTRDEIRTDLEP